MRDNKIISAVDKLSLSEAAKLRIISREVLQMESAVVTKNREKSAEAMVPKKREGMNNSNVI